MNLEKTRQAIPRLAPGVLILALIQVCAVARSAETGDSAPAPVPPVADPCPRSLAAGDVVQNPPALFSSNGVLNVRFSYQHRDRKSTRLNSSHPVISYAVFCLKTASGTIS